MSSPIPIPADIVVRSGPLLLGYLFNWGLYGALSVQAYFYYMAFPNDRVVVKSLVSGVYLLETAQTIITARDAWHVYALGFGDMADLANIQLAWLTVPVFSGIVSCTVQIFFAYRISILSRSRIAGVIIAIISFTQAGAAITQGIQAATINDYARLQSEAFVSCTIWLAGSALCDVIIAVTMSFFLLRADTGFKATQVLVNKLVRLTIETGSLTATIAILVLVFFLVFPHNNYHIAPAFTIAKLYSNTLLAIFNSRIRIVGGRNTTQPTELMELKFRSTSTTGDVPSRKFSSRGDISQIRFDVESAPAIELPGPIRLKSQVESNATSNTYISANGPNAVKREDFL